MDNIYSLCSKGLKKEIHIACTLNLLSRLPSSLQQLLIFGTDDISVHTTENFTCVCEDMILSDEADLAIVYGDCDETLFKVTKLDNYNQVFIVNKQHPLAAKNSIKLAELANIPLIIPYDRCRPAGFVRKRSADCMSGGISDTTARIWTRGMEPKRLLSFSYSSSFEPQTTVTV